MQEEIADEFRGDVKIKKLNELPLPYGISAQTSGTTDRIKLFCNSSILENLDF